MVCLMVCRLVVLSVRRLDGWMVGSLTVRQWLDVGTLCWIVCWVDGGTACWMVGLAENSLLEGWIGVVDWTSDMPQRKVLGTGRRKIEDSEVGRLFFFFFFFF